MKKVILTLFLFFSLLVISAAQTVYITKSGSKYHSADCSSLRKSSIPIELKNAIDRGFTACKKCDPPTSADSEEVKKSKSESQNLLKSSDEQPVVKKRNEVSSSGRCQAYTKKGTQCKRKAQSGSNYCWQHSK